MNADTFGEWVRKRRKVLDLTQEMLAGRVGCSLSTIRKIEKDERRPSRQIAELLADYLDVLPAERTLFLKAARGKGGIQRLDSRSDRAPAWVAIPTASPSPNRIPVPPTPFIGRQQEKASLARMLADPFSRLITILGPGGIGKTRLAIETARAHLDAFSGRIYFVQLATYSQPDSILAAIASVLEIPSSNTIELAARLTGYLHDKTILLVLDNFEHVLDGAPVLSDLLQQAPQLKILVTSRERLNLQGEWTFELSGLSVPPADDETSAIYSALQLFEQHAHRIHPNLQLVGAERAAAIRICQCVDGMPLAIELAAAWVNVLSCVEIANEIERSFDFLSSTLRDASPRHKSLRAVFEHSWQRLTAEEQHSLSQLSTFQGGFSREAAEAVTGSGLNVLSSLVSKSLLRRSESGRFDLHEVIRQYALGYLSNEKTVRDNHSRYYLDWLHESEPALYGNDEARRLQEFVAEVGNIHTAWEWALEQKSFAALDRALDSYWMAYDIHGWLQEGIGQTDALIQALRKEPQRNQQQVYLGRALAFHGMFLFRAGAYTQSRQYLEESIAILQKVGDTRYLPPALIFCGIVISLMGDLTYARELMDEGVEYATAHNITWFMALGQFDQGYVAGQAGDLDYAYERMQIGLLLWRELGNIRFVAFGLNFLSPIAIQLGKLDDARGYLQESLELSTQISDRWGIGTALGRLGSLALLNNDLPTAKARLEESLALFTDLGAKWDVAWALTQLGKIAVTSHESSEANKLLKRAVQLSLDAQAMPLALDAALEMADCLAHDGEIASALGIVLHILRHPASTQVTSQQAEERKKKWEPHLQQDEIVSLQATVNAERMDDVFRGLLE